MPTTVAARTASVQCAVCDGTDAQLWGRANSYELLQCNSCQVVFTYPMPNAEQLRRLYSNEQYFQTGGPSGYAAGYEVSAQSQSLLYETLLDQIGPPEFDAKLLEVGCAEGQFLDAARRRGWDVCGVELSSAAAATARSRFHVEVLEGQLDDQRLEPSSHSVVVLLDVIEHLADPVRTIRGAARVLRAGGLLILKTPDIGSPHARRLGMRWPQIKPPEHLVYFDVTSMTRMLHACGFQLDRLRPVGGTGIVAAFRRSAQRHPSLDWPNVIRALIAIKRVRWLAALMAHASALLGRQDSMVVFARKVSNGVDRASLSVVTDTPL